MEEEDNGEENPVVIPLQTQQPPPPKPKLLIVLPELIHQWCIEIREFIPTFKPMVYYGDKRIVSNAISKLTGTLTQDHEIFSNREENNNLIILTSISTLRTRHGPSELKKHRLHNGWDSGAATDAYHQQDKYWVLDLADKFSIIAIDEAHCIKNESTGSHSVVRWLNPEFTILATASILPNRITDFQGYMAFIQADPNLWSDSNLKEWGVDDKVNPFLLADNHPAAVLQMTYKAMEKFIIIHDEPTRAGMYLRKVWAKCMIRRTYASPNPRFPERLVGEAIASLFSRRIPCEFTPAELERYQIHSERPLSKLITHLPDGTLAWNRKNSRKLILLSSWLGFHYIGDDIYYSSLKKWKDNTKPSLLYRWVKLLHHRMTEQNAPDQWELPDINDIPGLLSIVCRGSPKLRATLRIVAELVILHKKKWIIWCSLPANQLLLYACFQALKLPSVCYTSELSREERGELVKAFTEDPEQRLFIGSWYVGSTGLNLQSQCNHNAEWDAPPSIGAMTQARGRSRRIGQLLAVENFELSVPSSFQDRVFHNTIIKSLPTAMAEVTFNVQEVEGTSSNDEVKGINIGRWFLVDGELVQAPDERGNHLALNQQLTPEGFLTALMATSRGMAIDTKDWEEEDLDQSFAISKV